MNGNHAQFDNQQDEFARWREAQVAGTPGVELLDEGGNWRSREVSYIAGPWRALARLIPRFTIEEFALHTGGPPNPYMHTVVRQPLTVFERPIPVGVVSNTYQMVQHTDVVEKCLEGLRQYQIDPQCLHCEVGLTLLGEWMNFRAYFPHEDGWSYTPAGEEKPLALRLECFNSVDGSSRLVVLFGWYRFVCANGLVIGQTKAEVRVIHNQRLDLEMVPHIIGRGFAQVRSEIQRLQEWQEHEFAESHLCEWVNGSLATAWGKKAACRVFHICHEGVDVEYVDAFATGRPTEKPVKVVMRVPGAPIPSHNLYDVSQALSWVATRRPNSEERLQWQLQIPGLLDELHDRQSTSDYRSRL